MSEEYRFVREFGWNGDANRLAEPLPDTARGLPSNHAELPA